MGSVYRYLITVAGSLFLNAFPALAAAEVAVIVSGNSPLSSLTPVELNDIFLGKKSTLPGVGIITPIDQAEGSNVRQEFYRKAMQKDESQIKAYWARRIFTGTGEPPKEAENSVAVKRTVASDPYTIGYIPQSEIDASVKPLLILP